MKFMNEPTKPTRKSLIKHFINKFEKIPEEQWCAFTTINAQGQRCALGHTMTDGTWVTRTAETDNLISLFGRHEENIPDINNGRFSRYNQPTPKLRVLAALRDKLAKEQ